MQFDDKKISDVSGQRILAANKPQENPTTNELHKTHVKLSLLCAAASASATYCAWKAKQ